MKNQESPIKFIIVITVLMRSIKKRQDIISLIHKVIRKENRGGVKLLVKQDKVEAQYKI